MKKMSAAAVLIAALLSSAPRIASAQVDKLKLSDAIQTIGRIVDLFPPHQQPLIRVQFAESLRAIVSQRLLTSTKGGRVASVEILINTPHVRKQIEDNKSIEIIQALQKGQFYGMITFNQSLVKLFKDGLATEAEVLSAASSPDDLKLALRGIEQEIKPA